MEVMIVGAIVSVMLAIALPRYQTLIQRSRQVEAVTQLAHLRYLQDAYYVTHDCFVSTEIKPQTPPSRAGQPWSSEAPRVRRDACAAEALNFEALGLRLAGKTVYFQYLCLAMQHSQGWDFACDARSDLDGDGELAQFLICSDTARRGHGLTIHGSSCLFPNQVYRTTEGSF